MRIIGTLLTTAAAAALLVTAPSVAHADSEDCMRYLEFVDRDTEVRGEICSDTETIAVIFSRSYALRLCVPVMRLTGLERSHALIACRLAVIR